MSQCVAVIPARMAASRLPGKPLLDIHGTPMIVRVARIAQQAACVDRVIVATDDGIFWKMHQLAPNKKLISAPTAGAGATCESCAHCPWMAMNALQNLEQVLITGDNAVTVDPATGVQAVKSIQRMLDFAAANRISGALPGR